MARILVVDDEAGVRGFIAEVLELDGHEVERARDGAEAGRILARRAFQLVITDLKMPRVDGMTLLRQIRAEQPETEVAVLTAHGSVQSAVEAMKLGAFDFLQKPLEGPGAVRLLARRALERRSLRDRQEGAAQDDAAPALTWGAPSMAPVVRALRRVAATDATVLLRGETGTGKEVAARAVHRWSRRSAGPFVAVNCAALSEHLLESALFGHERGAFTGADRRRRGKIELAAGGTLFLDEIGELKPALQAKLLRVLQERVFERVGGEQELRADVRWIAATHRDLEAMMAEGAFREDLYHRIGVFPVRLPPLRERPEDVPPLAQALLARIGGEIGRPGLSLSEGALAALAGAGWSGNVRQLANALERAAILSDGPTLEAGDLELPGGAPPPGAASAAPECQTMAEIERAAIESALARHGGNRRAAAEELGIGVRTLYDRLKRWSS